MSYTLSTVQKPGYLHIKVEGVNEAQVVRSYLKEIYIACLQKKCPNVLIEETLDGPVLSITDIYEIASRESQNVWPVVKLAAFVDTNPRHEFERMQFAENVAVTRGFNLRVFATISDAERWLLEQIQSKKDA